MKQGIPDEEEIEAARKAVKNLLRDGSIPADKLEPVIRALWPPPPQSSQRDESIKAMHKYFQAIGDAAGWNANCMMLGKLLGVLLPLPKTSESRLTPVEQFTAKYLEAVLVTDFIRADRAEWIALLYEEWAAADRNIREDPSGERFYKGIQFVTEKLIRVIREADQS